VLARFGDRLWLGLGHRLGVVTEAAISASNAASVSASTTASNVKPSCGPTVRASWSSNSSWTSVAVASARARATRAARPHPRPRRRPRRARHHIGDLHRDLVLEGNRQVLFVVRLAERDQAIDLADQLVVDIVRLSMYSSA